MIRALILGMLVWLGTLLAVAHADGVDRSVFETIWSKAEQLPPEKRDRLVPVFLNSVALADDDELLASWERRLGWAHQPEAAYTDYALEKVSGFIAREGWDAFFERAKTRAYPFNSGRPEMMAAAAEHLADDQTAVRIYALMELLGEQDQSRAGFERASFGHVLTEAAMRRCDLSQFERVLRMTDAPESIRYAFWRTRIDGHPSDTLGQIDRDSDPEDTVLLRQALGGYCNVLRLGTRERRPSENNPAGEHA